MAREKKPAIHSKKRPPIFFDLSNGSQTSESLSIDLDLYIFIKKNYKKFFLSLII